MPGRDIIYDGDPGIDDALAILLALGSGRLRLVTTVAGNVELDQGTKNTLNLLELAGRADIPVAQGARKPLARRLVTSKHVHGQDGLGDMNLPKPKLKAQNIGAVQLIKSEVLKNPCELTIVAAGPLTNLAQLLSEEPGIAGQVRKVVVMGGAVRVPGNITRYAEFNIHADPEAAQQVLQSDLDVTLVSLDVTMNVNNFLTPRGLEAMTEDGSVLSDFVARIGSFYMDFASHRGGSEGCPLHDPLAVAIALDGSLATTERIGVTVSSNSGRGRGQTLEDVNGTVARTKIDFCESVDSKRFIETFIRHITSLRS